MGATKVSPAKRKHGEVGAAGRQARLSDFGVRVTKQDGPAGSQKAPNRELANLGLGGGGKAAAPPATDRRTPRCGLASQQRQTRAAASAALAPTPPPTAAAVVPRKAAAAAKPRRASGGKQQPRRAAAGTAAGGQRSHLSQVTIDGETFRVGDNVYVVLDTEKVAQAGISNGDVEEEDCVCLVCGDSEKEARVMLECDRCLAGCHLGCLSPPLQEVPEGEWVCPACAAGRAPRARSPTTARDCLLQRHGLALARIEAIWQASGAGMHLRRGGCFADADGELECMYRWYCVPEETHTGRQRHHLARELFLTQQRDGDSMDAILRGAHVLGLREFGAGAACSALGEDVFVCEYQYDSAWQRFRRRTEFDSDSEDEDGGEEWAPGAGGQASDSEDEEELVPEQDLAPAGGARRKAGNGGINRQHKQGGEEYLAQVGALAVPEHARQRQRGASGALGQARDVLALTAVPRSLPCRDVERGQVAEFVQEVLAEGGGKCLYISGIPGTGKTATVLEVMRGLKRKSEVGELPHFQFVEINGLRLPSPQHAYSALYEALTGDRAGPQAASAALEGMFGGGGGGGRGEGRRPTIVLVDEMDLLVNKSQTVLYNLFDWPGRKGSRLSIIGIANTMDLPERLHARIGSRLAGRRVVFQPYSKDQLQEIIKARLEGLSAFQPNALEFISRKVANCSGDVRRCLELCRRAAEIAEDKLRKQQQQQVQGSESAAGEQAQQESGMVEMRHVGAAIAEMFSTGHVRLLREACRLERLLLGALYLELSSSGRAECLLLDVWERLRVLCSQNCEAQRYDFGSVLERAAELGAKRLIICDPGVRRVRAKVALNVAPNDLLMVLSSDAELPWLEAAISRAAATAPVMAAE
ncbi:hypothetical protein CHLNCDRAFT_139139 [Chlorella variabilis]|uniref:Origin recognition complex subunit 1 n=1 Tax=Chlorella variabilis TaxID=554065 RepID=E1ZPI9_CHLVA|nr:hypothetical protein CHLNCDRAFT_139139 [Chlorella variabilis]EFN52332.1 hypothetical protein CHLNCDRAFT_139139 [Chlorella variabilis]|eukprot:XP_005844434.1 hypothetical protein CHLNCDRAFT_139139 [Chlorella variabilis]